MEKKDHEGGGEKVTQQGNIGKKSDSARMWGDGDGGEMLRGGKGTGWGKGSFEKRGELDEKGDAERDVDSGKV